MTRGGLVSLIAGVLLLTASAMGRASDMDDHITLGAKPGIASGSNFIALGSKLASPAAATSSPRQRRCA